MPLQIPNPPVASAVAEIEAPLLDLDPHLIAGLADDETVTTIDCGNGFSAYYSSNTADRVKWRNAGNGHNGRAILRFAQQGHIRIDDVFATPRHRNVSIYWAFRITIAGAQPMFSFHAGGNTNTALWMRLGTVEPPGWSLDSRLFHAAAQSRPDGWHSGFLASDRDTQTYTVGRGDVSYDMQAYRVSNGGVTASNMTAGNGLQLGAPSNGMGMDLARLIVFPKKLTWAKHVELSRYLAATYATQDHTAHAGVVLCLGNSTTAEGPPYYLAHELAADLGWPVYNTGISSGNVGTMTAQNSEILELIQTYRAMGKKVVLVVHHGHNNSYDSATIAHLKSAQFSAYRAAGAYMILCAPTPWHSETARETNRLRMLQWIRGEIRAGDSDRPQWVSNYADALDGPSYYDALVDLDDARVEGDRVLGNWSATVPPPLPSSPPHPEEGYYRDSVHHTVSGYQLIAELQAPAVRAAVASTPGLIVPAVPSRSAGTADSLTVTATAPSGGRAPYSHRLRLDGEDAGAVSSFPHFLTDLAPGTEYSVVIRTEDATGYYRDSSPVLMTTEEGDGATDLSPLAASLLMLL